MKYIVVNTALFLNGQLVPEGSILALSKDEIVGIEDYLQPIEEEATVTNSNKKPIIKKEKLK